MIIPDYLPPHKEIDGIVTPEDRLQMCRRAFSHIENVEISDIEIKRGGRSYTAYTLEELESPERELFFLCGTDMFLSMHSWYKPELIFKLATICLVRRENDAEKSSLIEKTVAEYRRDFSARIIEITCDATEISSSEIRKKFASGEISTFLSKPVIEYINERGLY